MPDFSLVVEPEPDYGGFLSREEGELTRYNSGFRNLMFSAAWLTATRPLNNRVCTIPERGWKRRVVSAPEGFANTAGGALNRALLSALRKERRCRRFLLGERRRAVEELVRAFRLGHVVVSTDLSVATDRLPHDLVGQVVNGLIAGWKGLPDVWGEALVALTGPQVLTYPWGQTVTSRRGVLMGLGPSWPIMSIIHLFWVDYAASLGRGLQNSARFGTAIGGDDLIGFWPQQLLENYLSVLTACGGKPSKGKFFVNCRVGNFTEMTFTVVPGVPGPSIRWAAGIPVKGLVSLSLDLEGEAYESLCPDSGRATRARRVLRALRPGVWRRSRESGCVPVLPRVLGGAGLPPRRGSLAKVFAPKWMRLALGKFLYGSGSDQVPLAPPSWVESTDLVSRTARERSEAVLFREVEFGMVEFSTQYKPGRVSRLVSDWLQNETSLFSQAAVFSDDSCPASNTDVADARTHGRQVRQWALKRLRGGVPDAQAIKNGRNSRYALIERARFNRRRWYINLLLPPEFYYGDSI